MIALFLTTTITCSQAFALIQRIRTSVLLDETAKTEMIDILRETIPTCPIKIKPDGR